MLSNISVPSKLWLTAIVESITDHESVDKWYDNDFHKMYISEITKVLVKV